MTLETQVYQDGLNERDGESLRTLWSLLEETREEVERTLAQVRARTPEFSLALRGMSENEQRAFEEQRRQHQRRALLEGEWQELLDLQRKQGERFALRGVPYGAWFSLMSTLRRTLSDHIRHKFEDQPREALELLRAVDIYVDRNLAVIGDAYIRAKEQVITRQATEIRELSTPVLQVSDGLLILPILGLIDTHRARQITENLLATIRRRRGRAVVMDVTGVPIVDSKVANHLVQTVDAARLMGARVVVTGISSEIAQTLVAIGAELRDIPTLGELQDGIEWALKYLKEQSPLERTLRRNEAEETSS